jgi:hypothetical protein
MSLFQIGKVQSLEYEVELLALLMFQWLVNLLFFGSSICTISAARDIPGPEVEESFVIDVVESSAV